MTTSERPTPPLARIFGTSFIRDISSLLTLAIVVLIVVAFPGRFQDWGNVLGALIGTLGAFLVARFSITATQEHALAAKNHDEQRKRDAITTVVVRDLATWIETYFEWRAQARIWQTPAMQTRSRLYQVLGDAALFDEQTINAILGVDAAFTTVTQLLNLNGGRIFLNAYVDDLSGYEFSRNFLKPCIVAWIELARRVPKYRNLANELDALPWTPPIECDNKGERVLSATDIQLPVTKPTPLSPKVDGQRV